MPLKKTGIFILFAALISLAAFLFYQNLDQQESTRLKDTRGIEIPFGISWEEQGRVRVSGILESSNINIDSEGKYLTILLPAGSMSETDSSVRGYFRENDAVSVLTLKDGLDTDPQAWKGHFVQDLQKKLTPGTQVILFFQNVEEKEFQDLLDGVKIQSGIQIMEMTNIIIAE